MCLFEASKQTNKQTNKQSPLVAGLSVYLPACLPLPVCLCLSVSIWDHTACICLPVCLCLPLRNVMSACLCPVWSHLGASGSLWEHLGASGKHLRVFGTIWKAAGSIYRSIWRESGETPGRDLGAPGVPGNLGGIWGPTVFIYLYFISKGGATERLV